MQMQLPLVSYSDKFQCLLNNPEKIVQFGPSGFQFINSVWPSVAEEAFRLTLEDGQRFGTSEFEKVYSYYETLLICQLEYAVKGYAHGMH